MFQDDLERTLSQLRVLAESRMTSRATIRRLTTETTTDAKGFKVPVYAEVLADVPFRLIRGEGYRTVRIGDSERQVAARDGDFPVGTPLLDDDLVEVTEGESAGRIVRVLESMPSDQRKSLRVPVIEEQKPEGWV